MTDARRCYEHGNEYPYDNDMEKDDTKDWAHKAARGVLADLCDRRGIKHALHEIDDDIKKEIAASLAEIIRIADEERQKAGGNCDAAH